VLRSQYAVTSAEGHGCLRGKCHRGEGRRGDPRTVVGMAGVSDGLGSLIVGSADRR